MSCLDLGPVKEYPDNPDVDPSVCPRENTDTEQDHTMSWTIGFTFSRNGLPALQVAGRCLCGFEMKGQIETEEEQFIGEIDT